MTLQTEDEAWAWLSETFGAVSRDRLEAFAELLRCEGERQNLISRATFDQVAVRHFADSAQLLLQAPTPAQDWLDLGSGAGFPALVVALLSPHRMTMVESRRLRVEFLHKAAETLGVADRTTIIGSPVERVPARPFDIISARAFAPLPRLLELATPFSTEKTLWLLPKGRSVHSELESAQPSWQGEFHVEQSITDAEAGIIVAKGVRPRSQGKTR